MADEASLNESAFWRLGGFSDEQLLERLAKVLGSGRRLLAELVAHLAEVEQRRLHLAVSCGSMFEYCVTRLRLSEDEACRRIQVARLARRFPSIFGLLASGELSLSVAALLAPHLTSENAAELLRMVLRQSVRQARESLAARFPQADVTSSVRKLPERSVVSAPVEVHAPSLVGALKVRAEQGQLAPAPAPKYSAVPVPPRAAVVEPLAPERYRIQFTACTELKAKLELARDLMRHAIPDGDFGAIVGRALDLLVEQVMKRRFGARTAASSRSRAIDRVASAKQADRQTLDAPGSRESSAAGPSPVDSSPVDPSPVDSSPTQPIRDRLHAQGQGREARGATAPAVAVQAVAAPGAEVSLADAAHSGAPHARGSSRDPSHAEESRGVSTISAPASSFARISRATRRRVVERAGLRCNWADEHGTRCESRAWLEFDHQTPLAKGGNSQPENVRLLCRNHNRLAAEQEFGRPHIELAIATRKQEHPSQVDPPPLE